MGSNRRYDSDVSYAKIANAVLRPRPVSLSKTEVGDDVHETTEANPVIAWIPFRTEDSVQVEGRVVAYTDRACQVEFTGRGGVTHRVWVWAGAVTKRPPRDP